MRTLAAWLLVTSLLAPSLAGAAGSGPPEEVAARGPPAPADFRFWSGAVRLTDCAEEDRNPDPAVDSKGNCGIAWNRGGSMMWVRVDRSGTRFALEKELVPGGFPVQPSGFTSPCIGMDSTGAFHVVAESGGDGAYYARFDANGDPVVPLRAVSAGAFGPCNPSIAVAPGGNVSVTYQDSRWGYSEQSIACTLLDRNGTVVKDCVRMGQAGWYCEGSTVVADCEGNIHAAILTTEAGIYHVKLDPDGNQLPQAPPTLLYKPSGSFYTDGPPAIACDGTGAVHVLWNDRPQGRGILKYMKLDGNGNKLAAGPGGAGIALTAGATCIGFPSIIADRTGTAYAFWSDCRDGAAQIWAIGLQSRILNDTSLPDQALCIVKSTGSAREPDVAFDRGENMFLAWRDDRDGNSELYFKFGFRCGINLTMTGSARQALSEVHPNRVSSGSLSLTNLGGCDDVAGLELAVNFTGHPGGTGNNYTGDGWKVWLSPPGPAVELGYLETKDIALNIRGPAAGVANDSIVVRVIASSQLALYPKHELSFRARLVMDHSLDIHATDKVHSASAGVPTAYTLDIRNGGAMDEGIDISASGPSGWKWELGAEHVHLKGREARYVGCTVTPPLDAAGDEVGTVTVTARLSEEPTVCDTVDTHTVVVPVLELGIWPGQTDGQVAPGDTTSYVITVGQAGNVRKPAPIMIEASGEREGWIVALDSTAVSLAAGESEGVVLMVSAPSGALAGDGLTVNVSCQNLEGTVTAGCAVTTRVLQSWEFSVAVESVNATIDAGGSALFHVEIFNTGNGPDTFWPDDLTGPAGWSVSLMGTRPGVDVRAGGIPVPAGGAGWFEAIVASPSNASTGLYRFFGLVRDGRGNTRPVDLSVRVNQAFGLELGSAEPDQAAETGARVIFPLMLRNTGNGPDSFWLNASALPDGWGAPEFRDGGNAVSDRLALNASGSGRMAVSVVIPLFTALGELRFHVTAFSAGGQNVTIGLFLKVLKAELAITGVEVLSKPLKVGDSALVRVTVKNDGEAPAANVTVACRHNGVMRSTVYPGPLDRGQNGSVTFIWVPVEGKNTLRFAVDPNDTVCESDETNNEASFQKQLYAEKVRLFPDGAWMVLAVLVPVVAAGLCLAARARRKGRARPR